jgi:RNA polymerase sigma factor (sigma-70 family)
MEFSFRDIDEIHFSEKYIQGDNESLGVLYKFYYSKLVLLAFKYLSDKDKSRDVVGSVFETLLVLSTKKRNELLLHKQKGLYPLLVVIVKNKCLDALKQQKTRLKIINFIGINAVISTNNIASRYSMEAFDLLLDNLPKREKEILKLHLSGYKHEEIAEREKISYNTVRNTVHAAKQKVKVIWNIFM